MFLHKEQSVF